MKDHVDKSMGIVTLIPEALTKIKPTDPFRVYIFVSLKRFVCLL
jgi:hypothetical protein